MSNKKKLVNVERQQHGGSLFIDKNHMTITLSFESSKGTKIVAMNFVYSCV